MSDEPRSDPPGSVSNQNGEEAESGHDSETTENPGGRHAGDEGKGDSDEKSQATGHPDNAG
jgi:hypothetical protein